MEDGTCPVCNGTGRQPATADQKRYAKVLAGYNTDDDTIGCRNCGGQRMFGKPTGRVKLNKEGVPCTHSYVSSNAGRCLTNYTCQFCDDRYQIDSGD